MSEQDSVRPFHAKDVAPGKEAADVVAEVLQHAQEREKAASKKVEHKGPPRWMLPLTVQLGVLAMYFLIAQPDFLVVNPIEDTRAVDTRVDQTRMAMYVGGIMKIEAYRQANGRLPSSLEEANAGDLASQGVDYAVQGDSAYTLIATVDSETISFDSVTQTAAAFAAQVQWNLPG